MHPHIRAVLAALTLLLPCPAPAQTTAPAGGKLVDDFLYASDAQARAAWKPMAGTAPVSIVSLAGRRVLKFPCNFAGTKLERASWDRAVELDLTACRGLELEMFSPDASPVSYFSLYLQSGEGWYHATFFPELTKDWERITLDKSTFGREGKPAGWGQIRTIRLSAWRGGEQDTEIRLRSLRVSGKLGADAQVAVLRGESQGGYAETITRMLDSFDIGCTQLSDLDLSAEQLKGAKVVILPHNPELPAKADEALGQYLRSGGKLLAFYTVPGTLQRLLGVQAGQHVRESRPGFFASIQPGAPALAVTPGPERRIHAAALAGAPALVRQHSWNINAFQPVPGEGRVLAQWYNDRGEPTGYPAVLGSTNGLVMTHILTPEDPANKARLLLAMVSYLAPELAQRAAQASLNRVAHGLGLGETDQALASIARPAATKPGAMKALDAARAARAEAQRLFERRDFFSAIDRASAARQSLTEAWAGVQPSAPGEFRAFWCHSAFGVQGLSWDAALEALAKNGFTAILPNMLWGGAAFYPSKVLPAAPEVATRGDQVAQCLAAARRHGIQVHVWKVNWNLGSAAPAAFREAMRREARLQAAASGREEPWLCPSHPQNQKLEIDSMLELARQYDLDGIHFDYIRYPDGDHCFCPGCRERFQRAAGVSIKNWPQDVLPGGPLRPQWLDWRRANITDVVRAVAEQVRAFKPKLKISAAVFRQWPADRDSVGQDWKLWCDRGWLNFVCPMDYTSSQRQFENMVSRQLEWAGSVPCYPGIGASASTPPLGAKGVIDQIQTTRRYRTGGFVIFNYGATEAGDLLPLLGLGATAQRY